LVEIACALTAAAAPAACDFFAAVVLRVSLFAWPARVFVVVAEVRPAFDVLGLGAAGVFFAAVFFAEALVFVLGFLAAAPDAAAVFLDTLVAPVVDLLTVFFAAVLRATLPVAALVLVVFLAGAFWAAAFLVVVLLAAFFLGAVAFAVLAADLLTDVFFTGDFLLVAFFVAAFFAVGFFAALPPSALPLPAAVFEVFFAEVFLAALATSGTSPLRNETSSQKPDFVAFYSPIPKPGRNINHFHCQAQCRWKLMRGASRRRRTLCVNARSARVETNDFLHGPEHAGARIGGAVLAKPVEYTGGIDAHGELFHVGPVKSADETL